MVNGLLFREKNTVEVKAWLDKHYSNFADEMSTEDDADSGRPKEAVTDENIKIVGKISLDDREVKLIMLVKALKISKKRVACVVHECLDMGKFCSKRVPRELTIDHKYRGIRPKTS